MKFNFCFSRKLFTLQLFQLVLFSEQQIINFLFFQTITKVGNINGINWNEIFLIKNRNNFDWVLHCYYIYIMLQYKKNFDNPNVKETYIFQMCSSLMGMHTAGVLPEMCTFLFIQMKNGKWAIYRTSIHRAIELSAIGRP